MDCWTRLAIPDDRLQELRDLADTYVEHLASDVGEPSQRHRKRASKLISSIEATTGIKPSRQRDQWETHPATSTTRPPERSRSRTSRSDQRRPRSGSNAPQAAPVILDAGAVSWLARRNRHTAALIAAFGSSCFWPFIVPSIVLVRCAARTDRSGEELNRFLAICEVSERLARPDAIRAGRLLRPTTYRVVEDAVVVTTAEGGGVVLARHTPNLRMLAADAHDVTVHPTKRQRRRG